MKPKHWLVFILLGAIWSSSFMWIKLAVQEVGPNDTGGVPGYIWAVVRHRGDRHPACQIAAHLQGLVPAVPAGLTNLAIPFFLISWGEKSIDSAIAAILDATVPLFTILLAHFLLHDDKITVPKLVGLLVGFGGIIVLMSKDIGASPGSLVGQAAVIVASIFYAISAVYARRVTERDARNFTQRRTAGLSHSRDVVGDTPVRKPGKNPADRDSPGWRCFFWVYSGRGWPLCCCIT